MEGQSEIDKKLVDDLMRAFGRFHRKEMELSDPDSVRKQSEAKVLFWLKDSQKSGGMKVSDLSKAMRVTTPFVTQVLNRLEEQDLIQRQHDKKDRRIVRITLTEKGQHAATHLQENFQEKFSVLAGHLGEKETEQLTLLLHKAFDFIEEQIRNDQKNNITGE